MKRIVIDTGVWVSALVFKGKPGRAVEKAATECIIAISKEIYDEIVDVLNRPKFADRVDPLSTVKLLESILKEGSQWVSLRGDVADCVDPKDNKFLDCALVAEASVILSSDRHLRSMDPYKGIRIVDPQEFLRL
jgi:uncharacterized protein